MTLICKIYINILMKRGSLLEPKTMSLNLNVNCPLNLLTVMSVIQW